MRQKAEQFLQDLKGIDLTKEEAKRQLGSQILSYDKSFQEQYSSHTPQQMAIDYKQSKSYIPVPEEGSEIEKFMKHTFIADGSVFGHYQHMMRQAKVPEYIKPPPQRPPKDPYGPEETSKYFLKLPFNYQDKNVNSKAQQRFIDQYPQSNIQNNQRIQNDQRPLMDNNSTMFYKYQLEMLQMEQKGVNNKEINLLKPDPEILLREQLKFNINKLGGLEDTIGVMQQSLQDFEIQNMVSRQYKEFMRIDPYNNVEVQNKFLYQPQDSDVMNHDGQEHLMHAITRQLDLTQGGMQSSMRHPFNSIIQQQIVEDDNYKKQENQQHSINSRILSSLEQSRLIRKQKEQQLNMII